MTIFLVAALVALFWLLSASADVVVVRMRRIAGAMKTGVPVLGLILGFFTTLPETAVALNAVAEGVPEISYGNLVGGFFAVLGLILGLVLLLNRRIETGDATKGLPLVLGYLLLPVLLGLDGRVGAWDGLLLVGGYVLWAALQVFRKRERAPKEGREKPSGRDFIVMIAGALVVLLVANLILRTTELLLEKIAISPYAIGFVVFALGTNLPELVVSFRAWRRKAAHLSLNHLLGSAVTNGLVIGVVGLMAGIPVETGPVFSFQAAVLAVLLGLVGVFAFTGRRLVAAEGAALVALYLLAALGQVIF